MVPPSPKPFPPDRSDESEGLVAERADDLVLPPRNWVLVLIRSRTLIRERRGGWQLVCTARELGIYLPRQGPVGLTAHSRSRLTGNTGRTPVSGRDADVPVCHDARFVRYY